MAPRGLDKPSRCAVEAKMRVIVSEIQKEQAEKLDEMVDLLNSRDVYYIYDFLQYLVQKIFKNRCNWDSIVCVYAIIEVLAKNDFRRVCNGNIDEYIKYYITSGMAGMVCVMLDNFTNDWLELGEHDWLQFLNKFSWNERKRSAILDFVLRKIYRYNFEC